MSSTRLNAALFAVLLDEVIGQLNQYRTKAIIDLAQLLRRVNKYANHRLEPIVSPCADIDTLPQLNVLLINSAFVKKLDYVTLRVHPCQAMVAGCRRHRSYFWRGGVGRKKLVLDLRSTAPPKSVDSYRATAAADYRQDGLRIPPELAVLERAEYCNCIHLSRTYIFMFMKEAKSGRVGRLAACQIPRVRVSGHPCKAALIEGPTFIFFIHKTGISTAGTRLILLAQWRAELGWASPIRITYSENVSEDERAILPRDLKEYANPHCPTGLIEELKPDPRYTCALDWFADCVQQGSIWDMRGRPIEATAADAAE